MLKRVTAKHLYGTSQTQMNYHVTEMVYLVLIVVKINLMGDGNLYLFRCQVYFSHEKKAFSAALSLYYIYINI